MYCSCAESRFVGGTGPTHTNRSVASSALFPLRIKDATEGERMNCLISQDFPCPVAPTNATTIAPAARSVVRLFLASAYELQSCRTVRPALLSPKTEILACRTRCMKTSSGSAGGTGWLSNKFTDQFRLEMRKTGECCLQKIITDWPRRESWGD